MNCIFCGYPVSLREKEGNPINWHVCHFGTKSLEDGFRMMDQFPEEVQRDYLKKVMRGRKKAYFVSINGQTVVFKRATIRDYLLQKFEGQPRD